MRLTRIPVGPAAAIFMLATFAGCSEQKSANSLNTVALPDSTSGPDSASTDAAATDVSKTDAAATPETGGNGDAGAAAETLQADVSSAEVDGKAVVEVSGGDSAAPSDSVAETVVEVAGTDTSGADSDVPPTSPDAAVVDSADTQTAVDTIADSAAVDSAVGNDGTAMPDAAPIDVAPAVCKAGELKRCWIECPQSYAAGCISGQIPILIMGTHKCTAGQWAGCDVQHQCGEFANGPCTPNSKANQSYLCTDGTAKSGAHICTKPLGVNCALSYYINWPVYDCPLICGGPDDTCAKDGEERACEVSCGSVNGSKAIGKQKCQNVCGGLYWNMCSTGEACK